MKQFKRVDTLMGWLAFAIAAFTYLSTIEPTASFWDCPEFITTGYKLEVGHPPGAPFFMLTANLFSQFVSDPTQVAIMVNAMSALLSAGCILFLFWTISHLVRKVICDNGVVQTTGQLIAIEGSAMVGALIYTFSDTFWFSAVEGEVYAYSSLFTAAVFWLILKWEDHADEAHSDRWLILIAYLTGLSIGVHLLNLLCLPALVLIFYYKKFPMATGRGTCMALLISFALIAGVLYGIVPGIVKVGGWFELLFVYDLGFSFDTGLIIYILLLFASVIWAIWETTVQKSRTRVNVAILISVSLLGIPFYGNTLASYVIWGILLLGLISFLLWFRYQGKDFISLRLKNTTMLCLLAIMMGYSSYAVIVIRSHANTPMDQNSPQDIFTLGEYLNREQYGERPLFYGQQFTQCMQPDAEGNYTRMVPLEYGDDGTPYKMTDEKIWRPKAKVTGDEKDEYRVKPKKDVMYAYNVLFPRMYSSDQRHMEQYTSWFADDNDWGKEITVKTRDPRTRGLSDVKLRVPTFFDNLKFFFNYQVNYMYWRYFMWNFSGRQNDIQGQYGEYDKGNWITGISFLDNMRLGDQSKLPDLVKQNKGHNVYYMLPLLLGILGILWQLSQGKKGLKQFWVVFMLFFMTGLAIVVYLNQTPLQPRERDYAYAGSFYAFAIWCGMGVAALAAVLRKVTKRETLGASLACISLGVPVLMACQNWDDHDRSGRYTCRDFGHNYLESLAETNPIIFTNGDNDTFPLWYSQETEGFRTDARVCNLSYLQTDWYIDQMRRGQYESPALPIKWEAWQYNDMCQVDRNFIYVQPGVLEDLLERYKDYPAQLKELLGDDPYELRNIIDKWILCDEPIIDLFDDPSVRYIPTDHAVIKIDKEAVKRSGMKIPNLVDTLSVDEQIPDYMTIRFNGGAISKSELMMYEMLANGQWDRPMYVACTVGAGNYGTLGDYFVREGLASRITPFETRGNEVDTDRMYDNMMNKFRYGGVDQKGIYLDETVLRMCYTHRNCFTILAKALLSEGKNDKARKVLEKCEKELPSYNVPNTGFSGALGMAECWIQLGDTEHAQPIVQDVIKYESQYMEFYTSSKKNLEQAISLGDYDECLYSLNNAYRLMASIADNLLNSGRVEDARKLLEHYEKIYPRKLTDNDESGLFYLAQEWHELGSNECANELITSIVDFNLRSLETYVKMPSFVKSKHGRELAMSAVYMANDANTFLRENGAPMLDAYAANDTNIFLREKAELESLTAEYEERLYNLYNRLLNILQPAGQE